MDAEKIQEFFLHHIEKMILVLVVGASGFLVYQGLQEENILETEQPDRLIEDAKRVRAEVDEDHNEAILADPDRHSDFDINYEIGRRRSPVEPGPYAVVTWEPKDAISNIRRQDPVLVPPTALQVHGVLAPMAFRSSDGLYALKDLEAADPVEVEVVVERKPRERRGRGRGAYGEESMEEMYGEMFGESEEDMYGGMEGYEEGYGDSMAASGPTRQIERSVGHATHRHAKHSQRYPSTTCARNRVVHRRYGRDALQDPVRILQRRVGTGRRLRPRSA